MKIKIKRLKFSVITLMLIIVIYFVLDYQFFFLIALPEWLSFLKNNQMNILVGIFGLFACFFCYIKFVRYNPKLYNKELKFSVICGLLWFVLVLYSIILYPNQPVRLTVGFHATLLYYFWIIPFLAMFDASDQEDTVFKILNVIALVWYLIVIYQHFAYELSGTVVFNMQELISSSTRDVERSYGIRISLKSVGNIMILYNFDAFFNKRKKGFKRIQDLIMLLLGVYCLIIIQQTRAMIFVVVCSIAVIAIMGADKLKSKTTVFALGLIAIGVLFYTGILGNFFESFSLSTSNANRYGTSIRLGAFAYYVKCFFDNPLLGNGFTSDYFYPNIQHSSSGMFFYSDVGLIGLLGEVGITAIVFYLYPLYRGIKTSFTAITIGERGKYSFMIGLCCYLILSSITLIITATNLMAAFPIIIAYIEKCYEKMKGCNKI